MVGAIGIGKAGLGQHLGTAAIGQHAPIAGQHIRRGLALAGCQQRAELDAHALALFVQGQQQGFPIGITQSVGDARAVQRIIGQAVRLGVAQHLQAVFQPAQVAVGLDQVLAIAGRHLPAFHQRLQGRQQAALAQGRLTAATDQLQRLGQEFDLADAAGAALDIVQPVLARDLGGDRRLHLAQTVERGEIQVAAIDEGPQRLQPGLAGGDIAGHRARLDPGVALPVAAFALEVLVHAGKRQRHPPGGAERTQAQVDAVAEAFGGGFVQQPRQALAKPGEILLGGQRPGAVGLAVVREGVDQIDVGGEVQLAAAELAQPEHHQLLCAAIGATHHAVAAGELLLQCRQAQLQAVFGQLGGARQGGVDVVQPQQIAPDQAGGGRCAVAAQLAGPGGGLQRVQHWQR